MEELNIDKVLKDQFNPTKEIQIDIQKNYPLSENSNEESPKFKMPELGQSELMGGVGMSEISQKPSFSREVPVSEAYDLINGEWMKKFPTFKQGRDNAEFAAQNQSGWDQTINGLTKASANVGEVILGNTAGFVYGITDWAKTGNFSSIYDNSFSKTLDDWNTKLSYQLPNYYSKDQKDMNIFQKATTANFWANDVMNGLSFTIGTAASEAIWTYATGGASLLLKGGRIAGKLGNVGKFGKLALGVEKTAEGLSKYKSLVGESLNNVITTAKLETKGAIIGSKIGSTINTARFIATSSGNEAGIEAFHFKKEALENFYNSFELQHGRKPTEEEISNISDKIDGAANKVFATNMAILGVSNLAMIGNMFSVKSPISAIKEGINKKLFGIGVEKVANEAGEQVFKGIERTSFQKAIGTLYTLTSPVLREGLYEEGLQGVTSKTANNWIERQYDPKYLGKALSISDDAWKAMSEQYGTKEGWNEIGIGGVVGLLGGTITGEFSQFKEKSNQQKEVVAKNLNAMNVTLNTLVSDINAKRYSTVSKVLASEDLAEKSKIKGDAVTAKLAHNEAVVAMLEMHNDPIMNTDFNNLLINFNNTVETTDVTQQEKDQIKDSFKELVDSYKQADAFSSAIVGSQGRLYATNFQASQVKKALTYSILQGQTASSIMEDSLNDMKPFLTDEYLNTIRRNEELNTLGKNKNRQVKNLSQRYRNWNKKLETTQKIIAEIQVSPNEIVGDRNSRLVEMQQKLLNIESEKKTIKEELEGIGKEIIQNRKASKILSKNINNSFISEDFIQAEDLLNLDKNLEEINKVFKQMNPISAKSLENSTQEYNKAKEALYEYNKAVLLISQGKFKPSIANDNPFSNLFKKFSKPEVNEDDYTSEFLTELNNFWTRKKTGYVEELQNKSLEDLTKELSSLNNKELLTEQEQQRVKDIQKEIEVLDDSTKINEDTPIKKTEDVVSEPLTVIEELEKRIQDILKLFKTDFIGTNDTEEILKNRPDTKDIERYRELLKNPNINNEEFSILKNKLSKWRIYDSLTTGEETVADLLEYIQQLQTEVEQENTLDSPKLEDILGNKEDFKGVDQVRDYSLSINTNYPATIHINKDNTVDITHQKPTSILARMNATDVKVKNKLISFSNIDTQKYGTKITFNSDSVERAIIIGKGGRVIMSENDFKAIPDITFLSSVSSWSYPVLHEKNFEGKWEAIKSDFTDLNITGDTNDLKPGDVLELYFDINNEYNQILLKNKDEDYITDQLVIYQRKNGVNYGTVKALDRSDIDLNIKLLREEAFKNFKEKNSAILATAQVEYVQLGNPIMSLTDGGIISKNNFTDDALRVVEATGYILNGEITLNKKVENIRKTFTKKITEKNKDKKVPLVIIKRGNQNIAFPITLKKIIVSKTEGLYNILDNDAMTDAQKVKQINDLLIENGISPNRYNLVTLDDNKIKNIETDLNNNEEFITAEALADKKYNKENLKKDATIALDLENLVVSLPSQKFNIDLDSIDFKNLIIEKSTSDKINDIESDELKQTENDAKC